MLYHILLISTSFSYIYTSFRQSKASLNELPNLTRPPEVIYVTVSKCDYIERRHF